MQRELLDPSDALQVIVRRWVVPLREAIERILARLAPELTPAERMRSSFSVVGQVAFYLTHRPALLLMMERRSWPRGFVDEVAEHVTEFALGGVERLRLAHRRNAAAGSPRSWCCSRRPSSRCFGCGAARAPATTRASSRASSACCAPR
jgi:hypothetical protein